MWNGDNGKIKCVWHEKNVLGTLKFKFFPKKERKKVWASKNMLGMWENEFGARKNVLLKACVLFFPF